MQGDIVIIIGTVYSANIVHFSKLIYFYRDRNFGPLFVLFFYIFGIDYPVISNRFVVVIRLVVLGTTFQEGGCRVVCVCVCAVRCRHLLPSHQYRGGT
jgi:hypothetical protein